MMSADSEMHFSGFSEHPTGEDLLSYPEALVSGIALARAVTLQYLREEVMRKPFRSGFTGTNITEMAHTPASALVDADAKPLVQALREFGSGHRHALPLDGWIIRDGESKGFAVIASISLVRFGIGSVSLPLCFQPGITQPIQNYDVTPEVTPPLSPHTGALAYHLALNGIPVSMDTIMRFSQGRANALKGKYGGRVLEGVVFVPQVQESSPTPQAA